MAEQLDQALSVLSEIDREVLALRHFEELTNTETAHVLSMTVQAASMRATCGRSAGCEKSSNRFPGFPIRMTDEPANFEPGFTACRSSGPLPLLPAATRWKCSRANSLGNRCAGAQRPDIEAYVKKYPKYADQIRELFPVLAALEDWKAYRE